MTYSQATGGVMRVDGAFVPADTANRDWIEYQAWLAAGGTLGGPIQETLEDSKVTARRGLERDAAARRAAVLEDGIDVATWRALVAEAELADADANPKASTYPLVYAEAALRGGTIQSAATEILTAHTAAVSAWADINTAKNAAAVNVEAAATVAAVQAAAALVSWPAASAPLP
ncbi:MAG: hypothetical protein AAFZ87_17595 [Planctomycetota bacterium]